MDDLDGTVRRRRWRAPVAFVLAAALAVTACGGGGSDDDAQTDTTAAAVDLNALVEEGTPVEGGTMTIGIAGETDGWNPAANQWALEGQIVGSSFMETLTAFNPDGVAVPWLAESLVPNEDASSWTIHLRKGIKFHDGTEMNAQAVVDSLKFQGSPQAIASIVTASIFDEPFVVDEYTLEVPLKIRWGAFPAQMAANYGYIMAPSMLAKDGFGSTAPVGTGAFKFDKAEKDRFVRVTRFADYWGGPCAVTEPTPEIVSLCESVGVPLGQPNGPFLDQMEFRPIADSLQRQQALLAGDVDMIQTKDPQTIADLRGDYQTVTDFTADNTFVMLSASKPPFDNVHARRAVAFATDRKALVDTIGAGLDIGMDSSPFGSDTFWGGLSEEESGYPAYDPEKAKEEIELYKADTGATGIDFTLLGVATTTDLQVMQTLAEQWKQVGINATLDTLKQEEVIATLISGSAQAILYQNYAFPDPDENYVFWSEDFVEGAFIINFAQFSNPALQDALDLGRQSQDPEFRKQAYDELVKELNVNAINVWLYNTPWALIAENDVRGLNWFREIPFSSFTAKPWISSLWKDPGAGSTSG